MSVPTPGSVTQSSVSTNGVTSQPVTVRFELDDNDQYRLNVRSDGWQFDDALVENRDYIRADHYIRINTGNGWRFHEQSRAYADGSKRFVTGFTQTNPEDFEADSNYLAMGYWLRVPQKWIAADGSLMPPADRAALVNDFEYGVFVNGGDPYEQANIQGLTERALYFGDVVAAYIDTSVPGEELALGGRVQLFADFGTSSEMGTISGRISDFKNYTVDFDDRTQLDLGDVVLDETTIGGSQSGFFTGDTRMTFDGDDYTGKWGGQFYGNGTLPTDQPASAAGTFGVATADKVIIGTFAAPNKVPIQ